jgi:hypothetical protein
MLLLDVLHCYQQQDCNSFSLRPFSQMCGGEISQSRTGGLITGW